MKFLPLSLFLSVFFFTHMLFAQITKQSLVGTWQLIHHTDNSPLQLAEDLVIEDLPGQTRERKEVQVPFRERWAFDGTYMYIQPFQSMVKVTTYEVDELHLTMNFQQPAKFKLVGQHGDTLKVAVEHRFMNYTDTLFFQKEEEGIGSFLAYQQHVRQKSIADLKLHGHYQYVLPAETLDRLGIELEPNDEFSLNLRFYPDSTVVFTPSVHDQGARGTNKCLECNKLDVQFFPYPFGVYTLVHEDDSLFIELTYAMEEDGALLRQTLVDPAKRLRFQAKTINEDLVLNNFYVPGLMEVGQTHFSFVEVEQMNFIFEE